ncbi:MAG: DUF481 domain-containing protein [Tannerella sp.]|nr:DUF481 domain-containing protein [Tannerella sp.]
MKRTIKQSVFTFLFLLISLMAFARENLQKDTIFLRNGEILIGDIKNMRLGMLSFDSKEVGLLDLKISKIKTINSSSDTLRIETSDKAIYFGALKPSSKPGWVYIVMKTGSHHIEIGNINTLLSLRPRFWDNFTGNITSGFSYSRSSGIGQLNFSASAIYTAKRFGVSISGSGISSIDTSTFSRDREDLNITGSYNVKNMWYGVLSLQYQRNLQLSIARRFQQLGGVGYKIAFSQNLQTMGIGGVSISQERSTTGNDQNLLCEIPLGFSINYFKFSHPDMQISSQHLFYVGLTQWGRVRYDSNTTFTWELFKNFDFSLNLYLSYDSRPPDPDSEKTDYVWNSRGTNL